MTSPLTPCPQKIEGAKFTPGPWEVDQTGYRTADNGLCVMAWPECVAVVGAGNPDQPQIANASLIAAAPEMLAALVATESAKTIQAFAEADRLRKSAIAKATASPL